jgi:hypothetical protein
MRPSDPQNGIPRFHWLYDFLLDAKGTHYTILKSIFFGKTSASILPAL